MSNNTIWFAGNKEGEIALPKFITDNSFEAYKRDCEFHVMRKALEYLIFIRPSKLCWIELSKNALNRNHSGLYCSLLNYKRF